MKHKIPEDFDGMEYLDLHPDLRDSGMDPTMHYTKYGIKEGRNYKSAFTIKKKDNFFKEKKVVIHIGLGRCGTSALQEALNPLRAILRKWKIYYPETDADIGGIANHKLAPAVSCKVSEAKECFISILKEFENSDDEILLLSSESFSNMHDSMYNTISNNLNAFNVKIFFFTKNQLQLIPSIYNYWSKIGLSFYNFKSFYNTTKEQWHYTKILERWEQSFGAENICCQVLRKGDDSLQLFAEMFTENTNYILERKFNNIRSNESLPIEELNILKFWDRITNSTINYIQFPGWEKVYEDYYRALHKNDKVRKVIVNILEYTSRKIPRKSRNYISDLQLNEIANYYSDSNNIFYRKYKIKV